MNLSFAKVERETFGTGIPEARSRNSVSETLSARKVPLAMGLQLGLEAYVRGRKDESLS